MKYISVSIYGTANEFFLNEEDEDILKLRVHFLLDDGLVKPALDLCQLSLRCERYSANLHLKLMRLFLLHKLNMREQFHAAVSAVTVLSRCI